MANEDMISTENPFLEDKLEREGLADNLTKIISSYSGPLVLSINGEWGAGKTKFIQMWKAKLEAGDAPCIYFNAWEDDYSDKPFFSFLAVMKDGFSNRKGSPSIKKVMDKGMAVGKSLMKKLAPQVISIASAGVINTDSDVTKKVVDGLEKIAGDFIESYPQEKNEIQAFKIELAKFANEVRHSKKNTSKFPLTIFVDELDRCRPTYAVELLETIKHLFNVDNVVFVLGIHRKQLACAVKCLYGAEMDGDEYLKRFVNHEFSFPEPSLKNFCKFQFEYLGMNEVFNNREKYNNQLYDKDEFKNSLYSLIEFFKPNLRVVGHIFSRLNIAIRNMDEDEFIEFPALAALVVFKLVREDEYEKIKNRNVKDPKVKQLLAEPDVIEFGKSKEWKSIRIFIECLSMTEDQINEKLMSFEIDHRPNRGRDFKEKIYFYKLKLEYSPMRVIELIEFTESFSGL